MAKKIDFSGLYEIEPTYIHSHISTFNESVSKIDEKSTFKELLDQIKVTLLQEIKSQRDYFEMLESGLIRELQAKDPVGAPKDRYEYMVLLDKLNADFKTSGAVVSNISDIKINLRTGDFNNKIKTIQDKIVNEIIGNLPKTPVKQKSESDASFKQRKKEWSETIKEVQKEKEKVLKNVNKLVDTELNKMDKKYSEILINIMKPLNELINYAGRLKNNNYRTSNNEEAKRAIITAVDNVLKIFEQFPYLKPLIQELEAGEILKIDYKDFEKEILKESPYKILRALNKMKEFDFYKDNFGNYQFSKLLGDFYEIGTVDFIISILSDNNINKDLYDKYAKLFLNSGDLSLLNNVKELAKTSTIDVQTVSYKEGPVLVHSGWSLKMKEGESTVDLDKTEVYKYFKNISVSIPKKDKNVWFYLKNNMFALSLFNEPSPYNTMSVSAFSEQMKIYDQFEREAIFIATIVKFLVGLVAKVEKDSESYYSSFGKGFRDYDDNKRIPEIYYTSYIFTNEGVYSTIDMLNYFIEILETSGIEEALKNIRVTLIERSEAERNLSAADLKDLWNEKTKTLKDWNKKIPMTYEILSQQDGVKNMLLKLSSGMGVGMGIYSHSTFTINKSQMEYIKSLKGGK